MWRERERVARRARAIDEADAWAKVGRLHARLRLARFAEGLGVGLVVMGGLGLVSTLARADGRWGVVAMGVGVACAVGVIWGDARLRRPAALVQWIEAATPALRNQLVTLFELAEGRLIAPLYVRQRLARLVLSAVSGVDPARLVPGARRVTAGVAGALAIAAWAACAALVGPAVAGPGSQATGSSTGAASDGPRRSASLDAVSVIVVAPAYSGLDPVTAVDPERVSALVGSRVVVEVDATDGIVTLVSHRAGPAPVERVAPGRFRGEVEAVDTGYLVVGLEPDSGVEAAFAPRRLIGLEVGEDRSPVVRLTAPGRDLLLADAGRQVRVAIEAEDDFGLAELSLTYTIASGSGETFDFTEGVLPLAVVRESARRWRADGTLPLVALGVQPGDTIVYRAVAADRRPGPARFGASETFVVEIAQERLAAAADFELPDDQARFALSQQMVLVKTERLHAQRSTLAPAQLLDQSMAIAAEQRMVRAEFVFMMGGDVEDEEEEAAHSHEIQEGRLENQGRRELVCAIQFMSESERALNLAATGEALPVQRAAIDMLQRAFGRSRYILRTLPVRARIDPTRRLSGDLTDVGPSIGRSAASVTPDDRAVSTLGAIVSLAARVSRAESPEAWRRDVADVAEAVLALDPTSESLARASQHLLAIARDPAAGPDAAHDALADAASSVGAILPRTRARWSAPVGAVAGAFVEARRPGGASR